MCGIAGWIDFKHDISSKTSIIEAMTDTLKLRGPDSYGYANTSHVLFGHRRLVVVDPSGGKQPMTKTLNGFKYTLIYNGELYNTEDIVEKIGVERSKEFFNSADLVIIVLLFSCNGENAGDCFQTVGSILQEEINPFVDKLREANIKVTAIHNHWLFENPRLFYIHFESIGHPIIFAKHVADALAVLKC